jgi:hypothetical protein
MELVSALTLNFPNPMPYRLRLPLLEIRHNQLIKSKSEVCIYFVTNRLQCNRVLTSLPHFQLG